MQIDIPIMFPLFENENLMDMEQENFGKAAIHRRISREAAPY